jgi:glycosyltransferase involved in cell wall biosynthesis
MSEIKKILIITDAWHPQINGVVRTLEKTAECLSKNYEVSFITPESCKSFSLPLYSEIPLVWHISQRIFKEAINSNTAIHIATEGGLGFYARKYCHKNNLRYTTSYHSKFPEIINKYTKIPLSLSYRYLKWFHSKSSSVMVPTTSVQTLLRNKKFSNVNIWSRGVDTNYFNPPKNKEDKKILLYVGRLSPEKGIEDFLDLYYNPKFNGYRFRVVGDGPQSDQLKQRFPFAEFTGAKAGPELVEEYQNATMFVFPSKNDTFGLVVLEALACGTPVVAYPSAAAAEISKVSDRAVFCNTDLSIGLEQALGNYNIDFCLDTARLYSWGNCSKTFFDNLVICQ